MSEEKDTLPTKEDTARVTDTTNVVGLDASEYPEGLYNHAGTFRVEYLQEVLEIVDTLGWDEVNVGSIEDPDESDEGRLLLVTPDCERPWHSSQASVGVAGRINTKYEEGQNDE